MARNATIERVTQETVIKLALDLDGRGAYQIETGVPFFDHMLTQIARHGFFNLTIIAKGDLEVDAHHTVEDVGICLGEAFKKALGNKVGIRRYGRGTMPMHEALASIVLDFSGRPFLVYNVTLPKTQIGNFELELIEEFFTAFCNHAGANVHVNLAYGDNLHHIAEAVFKAFARALDEATQVDSRVEGVLSSKGTLE